MAKNIKALFTFEILGRPPKHIVKTMGDLVEKLNELEGVKVDKKTIHEAKPIEQEGVGDLFTTFAEVDIIADDLNAIINVVFHALPAHVEIIEPSELEFKNFDLSSILSALTAKLHRYDEIAKGITIERNVLVSRLKEMQERVDNLEKSVKKPVKKKVGSKKERKGWKKGKGEKKK